MTRQRVASDLRIILPASEKRLISFLSTHYSLMVNEFETIYLPSEFFSFLRD
jgi:hypothetical protein